MCTQTAVEWMTQRCLLISFARDADEPPENLGAIQWTQDLAVPSTGCTNGCKCPVGICTRTSSVCKCSPSCICTRTSSVCRCSPACSCTRGKLRCRAGTCFAVQLEPLLPPCVQQADACWTLQPTAAPASPSASRSGTAVAFLPTPSASCMNLWAVGHLRHTWHLCDREQGKHQALQGHKAITSSDPSGAW